MVVRQHGSSAYTGPGHGEDRRGARGVREVKASVKSKKNRGKGEEGSSSHGGPSSAAMVLLWRETPARALPRRKRGRERAHGMVEVKAEPWASGIEEWHGEESAPCRCDGAAACGGTALRWH
jgi:hypothetical protein